MNAETGREAGCGWTDLPRLTRQVPRTRGWTMSKFLLGVHRETLRQELEKRGMPKKLAPDYTATFEGVELRSRWYDQLLGVFTVTVKAVQKGARRKSSQHRVYVKCTCGREIPAGRMHQHECK